MVARILLTSKATTKTPKPEPAPNLLHLVYVCDRNLNSLNSNPEGLRLQGLPGPQITYPFKDIFKEISIRNPKKVGFLGLRV